MHSVDAAAAVLLTLVWQRVGYCIHARDHTLLHFGITMPLQTVLNCKVYIAELLASIHGSDAAVLWHFYHKIWCLSACVYPRVTSCCITVLHLH
jgi:uncharacterized membrane protein